MQGPTGRNRASHRIMTAQILFIQGAGEDVHDGWDAKLVESLERELGPGLTVYYLRMPGEADPVYSV